jgi:hypothetical protein
MNFIVFSCTYNVVTQIIVSSKVSKFDKGFNYTNYTGLKCGLSYGLQYLRLDYTKMIAAKM